VKDFLKGTGLSTTKDTEYYVNYGYCEDIAAVEDAAQVLDGDFNVNGVKVEVIDNNSDGDVDYILYTVETLSVVTKYSTKNEQITVRAMNNNKAKSFDDVVFADEVGQDDLVLFVEYGGRAYISEPDTFTGTMTRVDRDKDNELYVTIDGETYKQSYIPNVTEDENETEHFNIKEAKEDPGFEKVTFVLDSNGYIVAYLEPDAAAPNYALVLGSAWSQNAKEVMGQVEILMTDGTTELFDINWKASAKAAFGNKTEDLEDYLGTRDVLNGNDVDAAAGTVIKYSLDEDNVLTIKEVLKLKNNDKNADIAYIDGDDKNLEGKLTTDYGRGDGTLRVDNDRYAVDLDTIAFYYAVDGDKTYSAVATGYDKMYDVEKNDTDEIVQIYTNTKGKLVEVVLFNAKVDDVAKDYLYVLSANAYTSKYLELNVVFQDGTVDTILVDRDTYEDDFLKAENFDTIWKYAVNKSGKYVLDPVKGSDSVIDGKYAHLVKNQTIVVNNMSDHNDEDYDDGWYYTITSKSNIWDVTDMSSKNDGETAPKGSFLYNNVRNISAVYDSDKNTIVAAWITDYVEGQDDPDLDDTNPIATEVTEIDVDNNVIYLNAFRGAKNRVETIENALAKAGYTDVETNPDGNGEYVVVAKIGSKTRNFTTVTTWYSNDVIGAVEATSTVYADWTPGMAVIGTGEELEDLGAVTDCVDGDRHMAFTFKPVAGKVTTLEIVNDKNVEIYTESYTYEDSNLHRFYINIDNSDENSMNGSGLMATPNPDAKSIPSGNYAWTVTSNGKVIESGTFTVA